MNDRPNFSPAPKTFKNIYWSFFGFFERARQTPKRRVFLSKEFSFKQHIFFSVFDLIARAKNWCFEINNNGKKIPCYFLFSENINAIRKIFLVDKLFATIYHQLCNHFETVAISQYIFQPKHQKCWKLTQKNQSLKPVSPPYQMFSTIYNFFSPILFIHFDQNFILFIDSHANKKIGFAVHFYY